ncbi:MAG: adenosylcobinamide-GDP ribazoletransferase [Gammaproteobacteria bacterium]|nr:adenosylcobinamide-GDP ribazoletransferase [Gammaproteobacteria bacterium]
MQAFLLALQLMTRLPVKLDESVYAEPELMGRSVLYYPLVGIIIGIALLIAQTLLTDFGLSNDSLLLAALILGIWVAITGALHLDGLGDSADAWLGGYGDPARSLEIMKDPRCGPAAVVTIVLLLLVKFAALTELTSEDWILLIISPMLARVAVIALFMTTPYVREKGMGESAAQSLSQKKALIVIAMAAVVTLLMYGMNGFWILVLSGLVFYFLRYLMLKRINGTTGDTAGAMIEVIEVSVLVVAVI